ncbi:TetR/AcrR family transcriptional regulator [Rhizobium sp.]
MPGTITKPEAGGRRMNRAEKSEATRNALFSAAIATVGEYGYADTSVARITEKAGVAQGTFYNYFDSRQDLLDQLLPSISVRLLEHVKQKVRGAADSPIARERARITGFFEFLEQTPHLFKMLHEGEIHAPEGFRRHATLQTQSYEKAMLQEHQKGNLKGIAASEIPALSEILMGARQWLSTRFCVKDGEIVQPPPDVIDTYMKLTVRGLFGLSAEHDGNG